MKRDTAETILGSQISEEVTQRFTDRTLRIFSDADRLTKIAKNLKNVMSDKSQGNMFEHLEVMKFNFDALKKDSDLYSQTTASLGRPTDPVDIIIKKGKITLREVQAKSCNSAARSAFSLSNKKYQEMARLAPKDQVKNIEKLLDNRIAKGTLKTEDYEQTKRNLLSTLEHDNIKSTGTEYQEALNSTDPKKAEEIASNYKRKAAMTDMHESGKKAGMVGASISGGITAISNLHAIHKGEKEVSEILANVTVSAAKGYATGYATTALSKGITHTSSQFLSSATANAFTKSNAPAAIASGVISSSKSMISYLKGDIESEKLLEELSHTAITGTSSFYYGALGQAVIPIPVVGALVGSMAGYFIGNILHQSGLIALGDAQIVKEAKSRRKHLEEMCLHLIPKIKQDRVELESKFNEYFSKRSKTFTDAFNNLDEAIIESNPDKFISGLETINNQFGKTLQFKTFNEFDSFMESNEAFEF